MIALKLGFNLIISGLDLHYPLSVDVIWLNITLDMVLFILQQTTAGLDIY